MGAEVSDSRQAGITMLMDWITEKSYVEAPPNANFRHLTHQEKQIIDNTILRVMQTDRRIETKLLALGLNDESILDALRW